LIGNGLRSSSTCMDVVLPACAEVPAARNV
jgi:hypothetical protein